MALLYLGSHWKYPRSSCLSCTSWQETDLELSRNRKVCSFHNSSCSLLVALCLSIGCHMGMRWAPLRPALPTPHSARNNKIKNNNAQRSTNTEIQIKALDEFYTSRSIPDLNSVYSWENLESHPVKISPALALDNTSPPAAIQSRQLQFVQVYPPSNLLPTQQQKSYNLKLFWEQRFYSLLKYTAN